MNKLMRKLFKTLILGFTHTERDYYQLAYGAATQGATGR